MDIPRELLGCSISVLDIPVSVAQSLKCYGLTTVGALLDCCHDDILSFDDTLALRGIGKKSRSKILNALRSLEDVNSFNYIVFERIEQLYTSQGMSLHKFAKVIGLSYNTLRNWRYYSIAPSLKSLVIIADYFGVSVDYLCGRG